MTHLLLALAGLGATHHHSHHARATWEACRSDVGCHWYSIEHATRRPVGHWHACTTSPAVTVCTTYPTFRRPKPQATVRPLSRQAVAAQATGQTFFLETTFYCLTGRTASGRMAGPGIVASYILPWGAHVRDTYTGWEGYVWDRSDILTQADEWLPCPQSFPTGVHKWVVLG